jgi:hypothetical protein
MAGRRKVLRHVAISPARAITELALRVVALTQFEYKIIK